MKRENFTLLFLLCTSLSFAQKSNVPLQNLTKLDLGFRGVGFSFEPALGKTMSIDLSTGLGGGYEISDNSFTYSWDLLAPAIYVIVNPKFYYNREKRSEKGKNMASNTGNFIGLAIKYTSRSIVENPTVWDALLFNLHWGIQRPVGKRWIFNTHVGVGYAVDATDLSNSSGSFYPALDLRFGYVLNYKKNNRG